MLKRKKTIQVQGKTTQDRSKTIPETTLNKRNEKEAHHPSKLPNNVIFLIKITKSF